MALEHFQFTVRNFNNGNVLLQKPMFLASVKNHKLMFSLPKDHRVDSVVTMLYSFIAQTQVC